MYPKTITLSQQLDALQGRADLSVATCRGVYAWDCVNPDTYAPIPHIFTLRNIAT